MNNWQKNISQNRKCYIKLIQKNLLKSISVNCQSRPFLHELMHQCSVAWSWSPCGSSVQEAQVGLIAASNPSALLDLEYFNFHLSILCQANSALPWSVLSADGGMWCSKNFLTDGSDVSLDKTKGSNASRWYGSPNHRWWSLHPGRKPHTAPQPTWLLCLSTILPDFGILLMSCNISVWGLLYHWYQLHSTPYNVSEWALLLQSSQSMSTFFNQTSPAST